MTGGVDCSNPSSPSCGAEWPASLSRRCFRYRLAMVAPDPAVRPEASGQREYSLRCVSKAEMAQRDMPNGPAALGGGLPAGAAPVSDRWRRDMARNGGLYCGLRWGVPLGSRPPWSAAARCSSEGDAGWSSGPPSTPFRQLVVDGAGEGSASTGRLAVASRLLRTGRSTAPRPVTILRVEPSSQMAA